MLKEEAFKLRKDGLSIGEISLALGKAKSTIFEWVKDIPFDKSLQDDKAKQNLNKALSKEIIDEIISLRQQNKFVSEISQILKVSPSSVIRYLDKADVSVLPPLLSRRDLKIKKWIKEAELFFDKNKNDPLFLLGLGLYWGEGAKSYNILEICNSDVGVIKNWLAWCKKFIPTREFRFRLYVHETSNEQEASNFWSDECSIDNSKIKVYHLKSKSVKNLSKVIDKMPNGVFYVAVGVGSFEEYTKMMHYLKLLRNNPIYT